MAGDIERQPGPVEQHRKVTAGLLADDVAPATAEIYTRSLSEFQKNLGPLSRGSLDGLLSSPESEVVVAAFMKLRFVDKTWGRDNAGAFLPALGRHCAGLQAQGLVATGWREALGPRRRRFPSWQRWASSKPHFPVSWSVALSLVAVCILSDIVAAATGVVQAFHCLTRVDEACGCHWGETCARLKL
jgi:hypothetical protein